MWTMKAAIFDMDGTVLDSMEQWRAQSVLLLERHGIELSDELSASLRQMSGVMAAKLYAKRLGIKPGVFRVDGLAPGRDGDGVHGL